MKVAIVMSGLGHVFRGAEAWAKSLAYALDKENVNVTLIKGGGKEDSEIERVIPCIKRSSSILGGSQSPIPWARRVQVEKNSFMLFLIPYLSMHQFDILHVRGLIPLLMLAKSAGFIKQKVCMHAYVMQRAWDMHDASDAITQPAPYYIEKARKEGIDTRKWFVLPNFVDTEKFNPRVKSNIREELGIPEDAFLVLSVGAIIRRSKRMHYLIKEAAKISKTANMFLLIVGQEEEETPQIKRLGKQLLGDRIRFAQFPHEKMPQIYATSDVFALASLREFFSIAFLEAMASGKPALGHNYDMIKYIIGEGGETIDMSKQNNLSNVLKKYIENPDLGIEKGKIARSRVENLFSSEKIVKDAIKIYQQVLED